MTVREALAAARVRLRASESPRYDAALLLAAALGRDATWLLAHDGDALDSGALRRYDAWIARRAGGEPVPYILGMAGFYGRAFAVTPDVLVPRPETELLVALALAHVAPDRAARIADVGTGSGILAITLALERPAARVTAVDVSPAALAVAARNAAALGVTGRLELRHANGLDGFAGDTPYDVILANLPYVRSDDLRDRPDPTAFEPRLALDGGPDGLHAYRRLVAAAPPLVAGGGLLLMEAGPDTVVELADCARRAFPAAEAMVRVHRDYAGLERVVEMVRWKSAADQ